MKKRKKKVIAIIFLIIIIISLLILSTFLTRNEKESKKDDEPDLDFITEGTDSIIFDKGVLSQFCPHIEYCPRKDLDTNCLYVKFLHCNKARDLEKEYKLKTKDRFYLIFRKLILKSYYKR